MAKPQAKTGSEMITLKPSEIRVAMDSCYRAGQSMMIWGPAGIGKSQIALQFANDNFPLRQDNVAYLEQLAIEAQDPDLPGTQKDIDALNAKLLDQEVNFIDFRLSQVEPSDLRGMPVPEVSYEVDGRAIVSAQITADMDVEQKTGVVWAAVKQLTLPEDWKGVLMFDEVNSAMPIVQAAAYQLFLDRCIGELDLPKGAFIMAAGNRDGDGGVTFQLATPLKDRMLHVEMKENLDDWINDYALKNRVHPDVIAFNKAMPKHFNTLSPRDPSPVGGSSPRSWADGVSKVLKANPHLDATKDHRKVLKALIAGRVGMGIAGEFMTFREMTSKLPAPDDILDGKITNAGKLDMSQSYALCTNLVFRTLDFFESRKTQEIDGAEWGKKASNFLKFIDENFGAEQPELVIMSVKTCMNQKCLFKPKEVKYYTTFAKNHKDLILSARDI
ncbi:AAA+ ATPase domain protein [Vibrio phage 2.275.O._10N.286.54.E11]|nr:AAA+ ATPase domain protein [Vibrio phage 2.275.O._10N.286.54.E11]